MNETFKLILWLLLFLGMVIGTISIFGGINDFKEYKAYKGFCEDRPTYCYCDFSQCEFKTEWSSINGLSNNTKELCKLANELNDKKTIFKVGCEIE
jgi:hypothetical protein